MRKETNKNGGGLMKLLGRGAHQGIVGTVVDRCDLVMEMEVAFSGSKLCMTILHKDVQDQDRNLIPSTGVNSDFGQIRTFHKKKLSLLIYHISDLFVLICSLLMSLSFRL